mgnify:CR=1 FL=1
MNAASFFLDALPPALAHALLPGGERRDELLAAGALAARLAGEGGAPELAELARELRLAAFETEPLDGVLAAAVTSDFAGFPGSAGSADSADPAGTAVFSAAYAKAARTLAQAVAGRFTPPGEDRYLARLLSKDEPGKLAAYAMDKAAKAPDNLFWRSLAAQALNRAGDQASLAGLFPERDGPLAPLSLRFQGDAAFFSGEFDRAVRRYEKALSLAPMPWTMTRLAAARLALGDRDGAAALLARAHAARPWHAGTLLRFFDLVFGLDRRLARLSGGAAALFYSYNKARDLDAALSSLAESDFYAGAVEGPAIALVLDNGSTDGTGAVIAAWAGRLGPERLVPIYLPVNVGAPAARNWLMRRPECAALTWTAFLDDDAVLPPDWTGRLAAAAEAYPGAGVWGCRVTDSGEPARVQAMDMFLSEPTENAAAPDNPFGRKFEPGRTNPRDPDIGRFAYLRPCASVTGCCHLFETRTLVSCGDFDIRFSPSQYDDLDHDIRLLLSGRTAVYQGHLAVGHRKRSGAAALAAGPAQGAAFANLFKLHGKYSLEQAAKAMDAARRAALDDLRRKEASLREAGRIPGDAGRDGKGERS